MSLPPLIAAKIAERAGERAAQEASRPIVGWRRRRIRELDEEGNPVGPTFEMSDQDVSITPGGVLAVAVAGFLAAVGVQRGLRTGTVDLVDTWEVTTSLGHKYKVQGIEPRVGDKAVR